MLAGRDDGRPLLGENCTFGHRSLRATSLSGLFCARGQKFEGNSEWFALFLAPEQDLCLTSLLLRPQMRPFLKLKKKIYALCRKHHKKKNLFFFVCRKFQISIDTFVTKKIIYFFSFSR